MVFNILYYNHIMAKNKEFEKEYRRIYLENTIKRKNARKSLRRVNKSYRTAICPECGGNMTWCESCGQFSSYCCEEYGTCMCS